MWAQVFFLEDRMDGEIETSHFLKCLTSHRKQDSWEYQNSVVVSPDYIVIISTREDCR